MTKVVIYPNNSVEVDGRSFHWPDEEFERYGIPKVRIVRGKAGSAEQRRVDGMHLVIFPTKEVGDRQRDTVRANADLLSAPQRKPKQDRNQCQVCGKPCRLKFCVEHGHANERAKRKRKQSENPFKRRRRSRRKHYRDEFGRLFLECKSCEAMKAEDKFYKNRKLKFGRYAPCKDCWNGYLERRKRNADGGTQTVHQDTHQHRP